jgi:hypothetical protein
VHAHTTQTKTGGSVPLPRVGGALSARSWQYQGLPHRCQTQRSREAWGEGARCASKSVSPRAISQHHGHSSVSTFRRARRTIRSGDFVHRLGGHLGGLGASRHPNGDAGGCEIGEGHWARARRRGAGGASRRPIRRGYNDRHWSLSRRTSHFDDQARTTDHRASTGAEDVAR